MTKTSLTSAGEHERPHWLPWSAFPFQIRLTDIGGMRIHYVDEGCGPALLLVSAGQWSFMFRDVIVRLRGQFRCLTWTSQAAGSPRMRRATITASPLARRSWRDSSTPWIYRTSRWSSTMPVARSVSSPRSGGPSDSGRW